MAEKEQGKPLTRFSYRTRSDEDEELSTELKFRQRKYIKCCGCVTAVFLLIAVTLLVLGFTVFHIKDPEVRMNSVTLPQLNLAAFNGTSGQRPNITLTADVSVKNPNAASFRYTNSTTSVYYRGEMVGEAQIPSGKAKARHTLRMNLTVDIITDKIAVESLAYDLRSGALAMSSFTKLSGRVKILNIFKKNIVVEMNCTMSYDVSSQSIQKQKCNSHVRV
ncbi:uncharacterized protein LOC132173708 [Corylus avellana]|uniref:uncharacterized protein LOC132173708 n=1 Tax=Corylus avellana TaxID=13451 RepID=UPI001E22EE17|nr:uncharacterized protein LOC132173708 [Corylus avellana]